MTSDYTFTIERGGVPLHGRFYHGEPSTVLSMADDYILTATILEVDFKSYDCIKQSERSYARTILNRGTSEQAQWYLIDFGRGLRISDVSLSECRMHFDNTSQ